MQGSKLYAPCWESAAWALGSTSVTIGCGMSWPHSRRYPVPACSVSLSTLSPVGRKGRHDGAANQPGVTASAIKAHFHVSRDRGHAGSRLCLRDRHAGRAVLVLRSLCFRNTDELVSRIAGAWHWCACPHSFQI